MTQSLVQLMAKSLNFIGVAKAFQNNITIQDQSGEVRITIDSKHIPFAAPDEAVLVCINVVKAGVSEVQEQSQIIMPDKRIIKPS